MSRRPTSETWGRPWRSLLSLWRRSLRTRVVTAIVVLCALVVGSVGFLVIRQISDGLLKSRVDTSLAEARSETATARERLGDAGGTDFDPETQLRLLVENLVSRGEVKGFEVVVLGPVGADEETGGVRTTPGLDAGSVPPSLRRAVEGDDDGLAWTYTRIQHSGPGREAGERVDQPGVAVGANVVLPSDGGTYALYYLFPMAQEQQTLELLRRVLLTAGILLLLLVAGVAALVTRQVITPVRMARRVAERIASGRLEERMHVSGEDDIARLATSFNQMAEALQSQIRKLVELSRVQRTFVSDVSHELRTPLTTVRMASDVLHDARSGFDPVTARAAELLQTELDRFENLLGDLLEISRYDAGAAVLELEDINLADVVHRVVAATAPMARQRGVPVAVVDDGVHVAEADLRRVERIVRNLVTNAIDHAEGSGVLIKLASDPDATALTVREHGVGLEPGQSAMVFNRFWRADPARARTTGGTGLGLAIALEDARLHGGWLQAWGIPAGGAQFRLTLPRRAGDPLTHSPLPLVPTDVREGVSLMRRLALVACVALTACSSLPESGSVQRVPEKASNQAEAAPYFQPPGPIEDSSRAKIVTDFFTAMTANPLSTSVARTFLSEPARAAWKPNRGTLVYEAFTVLEDPDGVRVRLADPRRLDGRGGWRGGTPGRSETIDVELVREDGQWRVDDPINALFVPSSFFERNFARYNLYFFDQTGRTLLPDPVFIPRGEQSATNLVRGLLAGPGAIGDVSRSALPRGTALDLSVVVTERGVAEVPLSREILQVSRSELSRVVAQLSWTLRQVPGIETLRITVRGTPVPLPNGGVDAPVSSGAEYDAAGTGAAFFWGLRAGRVVDLASDPAPITGPLGRPGFALRSFAVSESPRRVAGVSASGRSVFVGPADAADGGRVARVLTGGSDLLRPQYDQFGDLWIVDRTSSGAEVKVVRGGRVRTIGVPGVSGADLVAFAISRDGSRMAVAYEGVPAPSLRVVDILRTDEGIVSGAGRARTFPDGRNDAARIVDLGWRDPATLAVLTRPTAETSEVTFVSSDGSPVANGLVQPSVFRGAASALVVAPDTDLPLRLITPDQRLYTLSDNGSWPRSDSRVAAATYVR